MKIPFYGKLVLAIIVVMVLAQVAPEATNYVLALILIGLLLSKYPAFKKLLATVSTVGKKA